MFSIPEGLGTTQAYTQAVSMGMPWPLVPASRELDVLGVPQAKARNLEAAAVERSPWKLPAPEDVSRPCTLCWVAVKELKLSYHDGYVQQ